jgi:hypothetical protein
MNKYERLQAGRIVCISFIVGLVIMAFVMEIKSGGMVFFSIVMFLIPFSIGALAKEDFHIKVFSVGLLFSIIILWFCSIYITDIQGVRGEEKLRRVVKAIEIYKVENHAYPDNLDFISKELKYSFIGFYPKSINLYRYNDSTYKVGWDYEFRLYYDSQDSSWINSLKYKK